MKIQGTYTLPAKREQVWQLLTDPQRLPDCLPGCEELIAAGGDRYQVKLKLGIAAISGNYSGAVELSEKKPPASFRMKVEGRGAPGFLNGEGKIEFSEKDGGTEVRYSGEANVGGLIASVGSRMIEMAAKRVIQQFFENAAKKL